MKRWKNEYGHIFQSTVKRCCPFFEKKHNEKLEASKRRRCYQEVLDDEAKVIATILFSETKRTEFILCCMLQIQTCEEHVGAVFVTSMYGMNTTLLLCPHGPHTKSFLTWKNCIDVYQNAVSSI